MPRLRLPAGATSAHFPAHGATLRWRASLPLGVQGEPTAPLRRTTLPQPTPTALSR